MARIGTMPSNLDDKEDKNGQLFIYAYYALPLLMKLSGKKA
jgi:hypothetical protein